MLKSDIPESRQPFKKIATVRKGRGQVVGLNGHWLI